MAMQEMTFTLATLLKNYDFEIRIGAKIRVHGDITFRPLGGLPARVSKRV